MLFIDSVSDFEFQKNRLDCNIMDYKKLLTFQCDRKYLLLNLRSCSSRWPQAVHWKGWLGGLCTEGWLRGVAVKRGLWRLATERWVGVESGLWVRIWFSCVESGLGLLLGIECWLGALHVEGRLRRLLRGLHLRVVLLHVLTSDRVWDSIRVVTCVI